MNKNIYSFIAKDNFTKPLYVKFRLALEKFLNSISNSDFEAIILCGSFANNKITNLSDIDIVIVLPEGSKNSQAFKEVVYNEIKIQLFCFTNSELQNSFTWESEQIDRQRSSLIASGIVIYGDKKIGNDLILKAAETIKKKLPLLELENAQSMINFIDSQFPEQMTLEFKQSEYGFMLTLYGMMEKYFHILHQINNCPLPRHKDIDFKLSSIPDKECGELFCKILIEQNILIRMKYFFELSFLIKKRLTQFIELNYPV
ncbi:nucleotidyltransferase domain-containing protein [Spirochaeta dissipatitropha]